MKLSQVNTWAKHKKPKRKAPKKKKRQKRRQRKSGNGTSNKQWVYVIANFSYAIGIFLAELGFCLLVGFFSWWTVVVASLFIITKIGITGDLKDRERTIKKTSPGPDFLVYAVKIKNAYQVEQGVHKAFRRFNVPWFGSGHTEWFWVFVGLIAIIVTFVIFLAEWSWKVLKVLVVLFFIYLWLKSL